MTRIEEVLALFKKGFNCAQSIMAVYGRELALDHEISLRLANAFGGGMGKTGETCGAVTGALMVIGLKFGTGDLKDKASKAKTYELAGKFMKNFKARNNSTVCRELLGFDIGSNNNPAKNLIVSQKCPEFVKDAVEILEELLKNTER
jgi:C_GCAxxG_C_C family probable redox protein